MSNEEKISDALSVICTQVENLENNKDMLETEIQELTEELEDIKEKYVEKEKVVGWIKTLKSLTTQLYLHNTQKNRDKIFEELQKITEEC